VRPLHLFMQGIGPFAAPLSLDLDGLDGLIAVRGKNGQGKTTLLEAIGGPAALFREWPSRNADLRELATAKDARLELDLEHDGSEWKIVHLIDPAALGARGKVEAYLYRDGAPVTSGKVPDFNKAIADYFPAPDWFYSSAFAAQNARRSFGSLRAAQRRDLMAELLGLEDLQRIADRAKATASALDRDLSRLDGILAGSSSESLEELEAELVRARAEVERLSEAADQTTAQRRELRDRFVAARSRCESETRRRADLGAAAREAHARASAALRRADSLRVESSDARAVRLEDLRAAVAELRLAESSLLEAEASARSLQEAADRIAKDRESWRSARDARSRLLQAARSRLEAGRDLADLVDTREAIVSRLEAGEEAVAIARSAIPVVEPDELERLQGAPMRVRSSESALARLRAGLDAARLQAEPLESVPCGAGPMIPAPSCASVVGVVDCGACPLIAGATAARSSIPVLEEEIAAEEERLRLAREDSDRLTAIREATAAVPSFDSRALVAARESLEAARAARASLPELAAQEAAAVAELEASGAEPSSSEAEASARSAASAASAARARVAALRSSDPDARLADGAARMAQADVLAASAEEAARAGEDALAEARRLEGEIEAIRLDELEADLGTLKAEGQTAAAADDRAIYDRRTAESAVGSLEARRDQVQATAARLAAARTERADVAERHRIALLAEAATGRTGIQASLVEAAGPTLAATTNDLLRACYGDQFAIELKTYQEKTTTKIAREVLEILVHTKGRALDLSSLSGGEQVIADEAIQLALALYRGRTFGSLFRDEVEGRLDEDNRLAYPPMLRRALELGGFRSLWFISHAEEVWSQADRSLVVAGGSVSIV
jgi:DNA repair exonuclease SbcCD ATPase subunit